MTLDRKTVETLQPELDRTGVSALITCLDHIAAIEHEIAKQPAGLGRDMVTHRLDGLRAALPGAFRPARKKGL